MAIEITNERMLIKRSSVTGQIPTIPGSGVTNELDHTEGGWIPTDIYEGEFYLNIPDKKLWTRVDEEIILIGYSGMTGDFIDLGDTPSGYTGQEGKTLMVNGSATGLVFTDLASTFSFLDLTDTPVNYSGKDGYTLVVDETNSAVTFQEYATTIIENIIGFPPYVSGSTGDILVLNATVDGLEWESVELTQSLQLATDGGASTTNLMSYVADYSGSYVDRSIPDVGYVDGADTLLQVDIDANSGLIAGNTQNITLNDIDILANTNNIAALSAVTEAQDLQDVTDLGNTTTNPIIVEGTSDMYYNSNDVELNDGTYYTRLAFPISMTTDAKVTLKNEGGTIALLSDIPAATTPTLNEVLTEGSQASQDITFDDTMGIVFETGVVYEDTGVLYIEGDEIEVYVGGGTQEFQAGEDGTIALLEDITDYSGDISELSATTSQNSLDIDSNTTLIGVNINDITALSSQTYTNVSNIEQNALDIATLSGASSDNQTLASVLGFGNTTNGNDIKISGTDVLKFWNDDEGVYGSMYYDSNNYLYKLTDGIQDASTLELYSVKFWNSNSHMANLLSSNITSDQEWTLPDESGTIALTSDIVAAQDLQSVLDEGSTATITDTNFAVTVDGGNQINLKAGDTDADDWYGTIDMNEAGVLEIKTTDENDNSYSKLYASAEEHLIKLESSDGGDITNYLKVDNGKVKMEFDDGEYNSYITVNEYLLIQSDYPDGSAYSKIEMSGEEAILHLTSKYDNEQVSIFINPYDFKITDDRTTATGIEYAADYSANYTDRSLVDKAYVLSQAGGGSQDLQSVMSSGSTYSGTDEVLIETTSSMNIGSTSDELYLYGSANIYVQNNIEFEAGTVATFIGDVNFEGTTGVDNNLYFHDDLYDGAEGVIKAPNSEGGLYEYQLPNKSGTFAMMSDVPTIDTPTLQEVMTEGSTAKVSTEINMGIGELTSAYNRVILNDDYSKTIEIIHQTSGREARIDMFGGNMWLQGGDIGDGDKSSVSIGTHCSLSSKSGEKILMNNRVAIMDGLSDGSGPLDNNYSMPLTSGRLMVENTVNHSGAVTSITVVNGVITAIS